MTKTNETGATATPATDIPAGINFFDTKPVQQQPIAAQEEIKTDLPAEPTPATNQPSQQQPPTELPIAEIPEQKEQEAATVAAPETPAYAFANELSEQLFSYLKDGKTDDVLSFLSEQKTLAAVDTMDSEALIKLALKYEHPDYSEEELQGEFEERFNRPEKPEQEIDELDDEYNRRMEKWEKKNKAFENKLARESKGAKKCS
jgi:hypothetical protein